MTTMLPATSIDQLALLRLLRLVSPALPLGAFAYSQGLETAVDQGWLTSADAVRDWLDGLLEHNLAALDLPVLLRLHHAAVAGEYAALAEWNRYLLASRESAELRAEDVHLGQALWRLLDGLGIAPHPLRPEGDLSLAAAFAIAGAVWQIGPAPLLTGYAWCWLENQVGAATKLVPLGQTAAQGIIEALLPRLPQQVAAAAARTDDDIGASAPGLAWLSARHEDQYSRLFRS